MILQSSHSSDSPLGTTYKTLFGDILRPSIPMNITTALQYWSGMAARILLMIAPVDGGSIFLPSVIRNNLSWIRLEFDGINRLDTTDE